MWTLWTGGLSTRAVFVVVVLLLNGLLLFIIFTVLDYYRSTPTPYTLAHSIALFRHVSLGVLLLVAAATITVWLFLSLLARATLVVLVFAPNGMTKMQDYMIRLLASVPTLILGNAVLSLADRAHVRPQSFIGSVLFIIASLTLIGLPTVLQIGKEVFKDFDQRQLLQAAALGIGRIVIGNKIALPAVRRTLNAGVTLAMSRIVIEGYIVIHQTLKARAHISSASAPYEVLHIFYAAYSTVTIQANVFLIVLLFAIALLVNSWSFNLIPGSKA